MRGCSMHEALERKVPLVLLDAALSHVAPVQGIQERVVGDHHGELLPSIASAILRWAGSV